VGGGKDEEKRRDTESPHKFFSFPHSLQHKEAQKTKKGDKPRASCRPRRSRRADCFFRFRTRGKRDSVNIVDENARENKKEDQNSDDGLCSKMTTKSPLPLSARKGSGGLDAEQDAQPRQALFSGCGWFSPFSQGGKEW
jgi:hypothetical protein